jgi:hypothetical protein
MTVLLLLVHAFGTSKSADKSKDKGLDTSSAEFSKCCQLGDHCSPSLMIFVGFFDALTHPVVQTGSSVLNQLKIIFCPIAKATASEGLMLGFASTNP